MRNSANEGNLSYFLRSMADVPPRGTLCDLKAHQTPLSPAQGPEEIIHRVTRIQKPGRGHRPRRLPNLSPAVQTRKLRPRAVAESPLSAQHPSLHRKPGCISSVPVNHTKMLVTDNCGHPQCHPGAGISHSFHLRKEEPPSSFYSYTLQEVINLVCMNSNFQLKPSDRALFILSQTQPGEETPNGARGWGVSPLQPGRRQWPPVSDTGGEQDSLRSFCHGAGVLDIWGTWGSFPKF